MTVGVIVPSYALGRERVAAFRLVRAHLAELDWPVATSLGRTPAEARNRGAALREEDVLVFNDADTLVRLPQIRKAARLAAEEPGLVFAFTQYRRLSQAMTASLAHPWDALTALADQVFDAPPSHGCVAIQRACFDELDGYDERLEVFEDIALTARAEERWSHRRVEGAATHLWHPRVGEVGEPAWEERYAESRRVWEAEYPSVVVPHG